MVSKGGYRENAFEAPLMVSKGFFLHTGLHTIDSIVRVCRTMRKFRPCTGRNCTECIFIGLVLVQQCRDF
jgi:hypothetical protein